MSVSIASMGSAADRPSLCMTIRPWASSSDSEVVVPTAWAVATRSSPAASNDLIGDDARRASGSGTDSTGEHGRGAAARETGAADRQPLDRDIRAHGERVGVPGSLADDRDQRRAGVARLRRAVDDDRLGDRRQGRGRRDRLDAGTRDGEVDRIRPARGGVGIEDGLAERAGAAVGRRRDHELTGRDDDREPGPGSVRAPSDCGIQAQRGVALVSRRRGERHSGQRRVERRERAAVG